MRPTALFLLFYFILIGCSKTVLYKENTGEYPIGTYDIVVDFQYGFDKDLVEFYLDDQKIFSQLLVSDETIGLAKSILIKNTEMDKIKIVVRLNKSTTYSFGVELSRGRYLGIFKNIQDNKIYIEQSKNKILYD